MNEKKKKTLYEIPYSNKMLLWLGQDDAILRVKRSIEFFICIADPHFPLPPPPGSHGRCVCRSTECHACLHSEARFVYSVTQQNVIHTFRHSLPKKRKRKKGGRRVVLYVGEGLLRTVFSNFSAYTLGAMTLKF